MNLVNDVHNEIDD